VGFSRLSLTVEAGNNGMRIRSLLGCLLLSLSALAFIEVVVDAAAYHAPMRQQWRAQQQSPTRVSQHKTPGVLTEVSRLSALSVVGPVLVSDHPDFLTPLPPSVFVPPRV
jgi:hypothetical protein